MYLHQLWEQDMTQRDRMELATEKKKSWNLHCFYAYWISFDTKQHKEVLATNTWNRFQAGCIHYNGKPNISAAGILNKILPTDDKQVFLQLRGCVWDQTSKPVKDLLSYGHATL
jgi:hypothetical protein